MSKRTIGLSLLGLGLVLTLLGLTADFIGLGDGTRIGYKQITSIVVGALAIATGIVIGRRPT